MQVKLYFLLVLAGLAPVVRGQNLVPDGKDRKYGEKPEQNE